MPQRQSKHSPARPSKKAPWSGTRGKEGKNVVKAFEEAIKQTKEKVHYVLRLYVTGTTPRSTAAVTNIRKLCEQYLKGRYDLEVIDIYQQPVLAQGEQIIAAPTLIKQLPSPLRKVVGDLSNEDKVLMGLDIRPKAAM